MKTQGYAIRESIRAELDETRIALHELLQSLSEEDWQWLAVRPIPPEGLREDRGAVAA